MTSDERIAELEARISDLARENAVLKQVPMERMEGPRCPLRMKAFDQPDTCDPRCALLMESRGEGGKGKVLACAHAVDTGDSRWRPVNVAKVR